MYLMFSALFVMWSVVYVDVLCHDCGDVIDVRCHIYDTLCHVICILCRESILLQEPCPRNMSSKFDENLPARSQFYTNHRVNFLRLDIASPRPLDHSLFCVCPLFFYDKNDNKFHHILRYFTM